MPSTPPLSSLQEHFEQAFLPLLQNHAKHYFGRRFSRNPELIEELTQEAVANAWKCFVSIINNGKNPDDFPVMIAARACQMVMNGRRVHGQEKTTSVSNPLTQKREGFRVEHLPQSTQTGHEELYSTPAGQRMHDELEECLRDNTQTPPPDQAAFRHDYPAWLAEQGSFKRSILEEMAKGETTQALAEKFGKSPGRISQMRKQAHDDWHYRFHGEPKPDEGQGR